MLYKFGARFGFVAQDNEIEKCLIFLRTRLREISRCTSTDALSLNPDDEDRN